MEPRIRAVSVHIFGRSGAENMAIMKITELLAFATSGYLRRRY
jgi:hypothetical protein